MSEPGAEPVIQFRRYQERAFWCVARMMAFIWSRRRGKSFMLACKALDRMMEWVHDVYFISASLLTGQENIRKLAEVWLTVIEAYRVQAQKAGNLLESNTDGLDFDAVCEIFESSKTEVKIYHARTSFSRCRVLAPNPDTAVGYGGDMFFDEVGRIPMFKEVLEAAEPIMQDDPRFILWMSTTPPPDDAHPSFELLAPPVDHFEPNPEGNLYTSTGGIRVHRADARDAELAGIPFISPKTGEPISIEEARAAAFDKQAFDRNYLCKFLAGGVSALSLFIINRMMQKGELQGASGAYVTDTISTSVA